MEEDTENPDYEEQAKTKAEIIAIEARLPALLEAAKDNSVKKRTLQRLFSFGRVFRLQRS